MNVFGLFFAFLFVSRDVLCSEERFAAMEKQMSEMLSVISHLKTELIAVQEENIVLKGRVDFLMRKNDNSKEKTDASLVKTSMRKRLLAETAPVAFAAGLTRIVQLGAQQTLEYNSVLTNIGNGYDVRHGHFTAPRKGLYLLSFTMLGVGGETLYLEMVKNGARIAILYSPNIDRSCGSQTTTVVLQQGDMVWVRHYSGAASAYGNGAEHFNTFSGALLFEL